MITKDFTSFYEIRANFFKLIQTMVKNCFDVFTNIPEDNFKVILDCVVWAMKHDAPDQSQTGTKTLLVIMKHINK